MGNQKSHDEEVTFEQLDETVQELLRRALERNKDEDHFTAEDFESDTYRSSEKSDLLPANVF